MRCCFCLIEGGRAPENMMIHPMRPPVGALVRALAHPMRQQHERVNSSNSETG